MGFGSSLIRQVGRDSGKVISNKVFGDGHSVPRRNKVKFEGSGSKGSKGSNGNDQNDPAVKQAELEKEAQQTELEKVEKQQEIENDKHKQKKIDQITQLTVGENLEEIENNLEYLLSVANGYKDKRIKRVCTDKMEYGIMKLRSHEAQDKADFFAKKLKDLTTFKLFKLFK